MPLLGKPVRHEWALDWDFLSVNHGSFGAAPRVVLAAQQDWQRRLEAQPGCFMRAVLPDALRHAADRCNGCAIARRAPDNRRQCEQPTESLIDRHVYFFVASMTIACSGIRPGSTPN